MVDRESGIDEILSAVHQLSPHSIPGTNHWLLAMLSQHREKAEQLAQGLHAKQLAVQLQQMLLSNDTGAAVSAEVMMQRAGRQALAEGRSNTTLSDLCAAILTSAGYLLHSPQNTASVSLTVLQRMGRNLTAEARKGRLPALIGRTDEVQMVVETLCRQTKRNPVLIGPAGVGKTAIVEGLACRIAADNVPAPLRGVEVWSMEIQALVAGAGSQSEFYQLVQKLVQEAARPDVLLFLDEAHSLIGAGGAEGRGDLGSLLKPALARGDIACITATTDDEYRRYIEPDAALERRFQPIRIQPLSPAQTLQVLETRQKELEQKTGVQVGAHVLHALVETASRYLPNRQFPDKGVDLLEQCMAHALALEKNRVEEMDVLQVVQRMVGMPVDLEAATERLTCSLKEEGLLTPQDVHSLVHRLKISLSGLDMRPERPNATLLLTGACAHHAARIAELLAEALFGAADRVVSIDLGVMLQPQDITMLLGAPPGYVGYNETLALHRVAHTPWCVLYCQNLMRCHPQIREVLLQGVRSGLLTDARGKRIYLSDTVLLFATDIECDAEQTVGLRTRSASLSTRENAARALGEEFIAQMDEVFAHTAANTGSDVDSDCKNLLADLAARCTLHAIQLEWDSSFLEWMLECRRLASHPRDWERVVEEKLADLLGPHIAAAPVHLRLCCECGSPAAVVQCSTETESKQ